MTISSMTDSMNDLQVAYQLLQSASQPGPTHTSQKSSPTSSPSSSDNIQDVVSLSPQATSALATGGTNWDGSRSALSATSLYASALTMASSYMMQSQTQSMTVNRPPGGDTTFVLSDQSGGNKISLPAAALSALASGQPGAYSSILKQAANYTSQETLSKLAAVYTQQAADGVEGRFYKSTDPDQFASPSFLSQPDEAASFKAAFSNHTLTIQTFAEAGVTTSGASEEFLGSGETSGGGEVDARPVLAKSKFAIYANDPMFGGYVVSWGGPPTKPQS